MSECSCIRGCLFSSTIYVQLRRKLTVLIDMYQYGEPRDIFSDSSSSVSGADTIRYTHCMYMGVLCCFALFVCLTLLTSFFLPSHLSFI